MIKKIDEAAGGIFDGTPGNSFGQKEEINSNIRDLKFSQRCY